MGSIFRRRTGLVVVLAVLLGGAFAPSALATTPLTISKTATAHWTKSYRWTIDKRVNKTTIELKKGEYATATYTVSVTKSVASEAMWVDGEVCVTNNGEVATEGLAIEDRLRALLPGGDAQTLVNVFLDISENPVLDPGESHCYAYSLPFEPYEGAVGYENRAFATITNDPRGPGTALGPKADASFVPPADPTLVGGSVHVDDTNGMSWLFSDSGSQSYTKTFTCDRDKGTHVNTATIRETGQSDSATVVVKCEERRECPKGKHDKDKDDDHHGYGHWGNSWGYGDRGRTYSYRGRDGKKDDDHGRCGGDDDSSDDSSDDSTDDSDDSSDDDDHDYGRHHWGH
jgi:hypothetical protein